MSTTLTNRVTVSGIATTNGSFDEYTIDVPAGCPALIVRTSLSSGAGYLHAKFNATPALFDTISLVQTNTNYNIRTLVVPNPDAGTWHIAIEGTASTSGISLTATYDPYLTWVDVLSDAFWSSPDSSATWDGTKWNGVTPSTSGGVIVLRRVGSWPASAGMTLFKFVTDSAANQNPQVYKGPTSSAPTLVDTCSHDAGVVTGPGVVQTGVFKFARNDTYELHIFYADTVTGLFYAADDLDSLPTTPIPPDTLVFAVPSLRPAPFSPGGASEFR